MNMNWLKQLRKDTKQTELSRRTGIPRQRLCKIENGAALPTKAQSNAL
ncbi:MAG: helix-turn-helix transcriptional regulator, partial [Candidatus Eremiobacteraeota bacterium]|nr:helix-turn-helix transcriptional regulator [Candidatus Eremiobacteraeota bacterium]